MKKLITAIALTVFMAGSAFANSCPMHVKAIDEALATSTASEDVKAQAQALRDEGQALHEAGNHAESMAKLQEAEQLLGIGM
ncbi:hypothetical protein [Dongia deserti]|uniref:hypothetical protein n=1 Tax=Dongia deserti TaxID=2268030 RepID=UPI000E658B15|nr:hypothetical protein [Dongia deserti]